MLSLTPRQWLENAAEYLGSFRQMKSGGGFVRDKYGSYDVREDHCSVAFDHEFGSANVVSIISIRSECTRRIQKDGVTKLSRLARLMKKFHGQDLRCRLYLDTT